MSRYNHFAVRVYPQIRFDLLAVGDRFRMDKFKNGRRRKDIVMVKDSSESYYELKSGKEWKFLHPEFITVSAYLK